MMLESQYHDSSVFLTNTFNDQHLPENYSVDPACHKQFIDLLRTRFRRATGKKLRFYMVGEYGEDYQRPHYHYALFGYPRCSGPGPSWVGRKFFPCQCYECKFISEIWGKGNIFLGSLTVDSARYIAGYVTKKLTKDKCFCDFLQYPDHHPQCASFLLSGRHPEFARMSNRPYGIGAVAVDDIVQGLTSYGKIGKDDVPTALLHGNRPLPLGRYLSDKLHEKLGHEYEKGEKLRKYEAGLRSMLFNPEVDPRIVQAAGSSVEIALQLLNSQRVLNVERKNQIFTKERKI